MGFESSSGYLEIVMHSRFKLIIKDEDRCSIDAATSYDSLGEQKVLLDITKSGKTIIEFFLEESEAETLKTQIEEALKVIRDDDF